MKNIFLLLVSIIFLLNACQPTLQSKTGNKKINRLFIDTSSSNISIDLKDVIIVNELKNNSFEEDVAQSDKVPSGWKYCGDKEFVNINIHNSNSPSFEVNQTASHGNNYIALSTEGNDTWGIISQVLENPLKADSTYWFHFQACRASKYVKKLKTYSEDLNEEAVRVRVWGGNNACSKKELLGEIPSVNHENWFTYIFEMHPTVNHAAIFIEVYYIKNATFPYGGNVLIDNLSPIYLIPNKK